MRIESKYIKSLFILIGFLGIFCLGILLGGEFFLINNKDKFFDDENDADNNFNEITLLKPAQSSNFLDDEAGISYYSDTGQILDLTVAKAEFRTIEIDSDEYVVGSLELPNLPETEDVHCFVHIDGWIVIYYLKNEPVSKIIDWNFYSGGVLSKTKLSEGLEIMSLALSVIISHAYYYHFQFQLANKFMIIIDEATNSQDDSFNLKLPSEFLFYEESWSLHGAAHSHAVEVQYGELSTPLSLDVYHSMELYYFSKYISFTYYYYYGFRIDGGSMIGEVGHDDGTGRLAFILVYREL